MYLSSCLWALPATQQYPWLYSCQTWHAGQYNSLPSSTPWHSTVIFVCVCVCVCHPYNSLPSSTPWHSTDMFVCVCVCVCRHLSTRVLALRLGTHFDAHPNISREVYIYIDVYIFIDVYIYDSGPHFDSHTLISGTQLNDIRQVALLRMRMSQQNVLSDRSNSQSICRI